MGQQPISETEKINTFIERYLLKPWCLLPALIRGPVAGYIVGSIGIIGSSMLMEANFSFHEPIPWSAPLIIIFLWLYVQYFRGYGPPRPTSAARRSAAAWESLSKTQWKWASLGGLGLFIFVPASVALTFRFVELPPGLLDRSEEIAGMPLWVAIFITAFIFWIAHFNHDSGPVRAFLLFGGGVMAGYLAWKIGSIVPLVIAHTASDIYTGLITRNIIDGSYLFADDFVQNSGVDLHFASWAIVTLVSVGMVVLAGRKLDQLKSAVES